MNLFKAILLILPAFFLTACGGMHPIEKQAMYNNHSGAIDIFETEYTYETLPQSQFDKVCRSYYQLRNFQKFIECSDYMDDRLDTIGTKGMYGIYKDYGVMLPGFYVSTIEALLDTGQYSAALKYGQEYLRLSQEEYHILNNDSSFYPYGILALTYALMEETEKANEYLSTLKALEIDAFMIGGMLERERAIAAVRVMMVLKDYDKALAYMEEAEKQGNDFTSMYSMTGAMAGLSLLQLAFDPIQGAVRLAETASQAVALAEAQEIMENMMRITATYWKAKCLYEVGRLDEAKVLYDGLLADPLINEYANLLPSLLLDRGKIALENGAKKLAETMYAAAIDTVESQRSTISNDASKVGFVNDKLAAYGDMVSLLLKQNRDDEAFAYAERAKARALVDILAARKQFKSKTAGNNAQLVATLDDAEVAMVALTSDPVQRQAKRGLYVGTKEAIRTKAPELASLVTVTAPQAANIQALIPQGETLIEYYGHGDKLFAFVVTADGIRSSEIPSKSLHEDIANFREALTNPRSKAYKTQGKTLYDRLIAPLEKGFTGTKITIVPHGPLHYLPFAALTTDRGFMIDKYAMRVLPSASVMEFLKDRSDQPDSLLAFGNPNLNDPKLDLPGAQREVVAISKKIKGSKVFLREDATKDVLIDHGGDFKFLHFATHGTFNPDKPLDSGLLLAGDSATDGMLTVDELYDISLNADLVTLSACETGLGKVSNGDDVIGLTRGFLFAGTSTIISSLWQVDDKATAILMENMYANLKKQDKRTALRNAQLRVKKKYKSHPYYWAAFQLTGNI